MRRVYKYPIPVLGQLVTLALPKGYEIVGYGHQGDPQTCFVWAVVDVDVEKLVEATFAVYGTGHDIPEAFLVPEAVVNLHPMPLVWHVFRVPE